MMIRICIKSLTAVDLFPWTRSKRHCQSFPLLGRPSFRFARPNSNTSAWPFIALIRHFFSLYVSSFSFLFSLKFCHFSTIPHPCGKPSKETTHFQSMHNRSFNLHNTLILVCCSILLCCGSVNAQITIPSKPEGFWYNKDYVDANSILIEAFFDPVCSDSRDSWPPLKQAIKHYGSPITLLVHTFTLPYHDNSFLASRALHIVSKLNASATYKLLEAFFEEQERFYGKPTFNLSRAHVQDQIAEFAAETVGSCYASAIKLGFSDSSTDLATRSAFKFGCLRGVYGTPFFFVNGFPVPGAGSAIDFKGWKQIIDPLIKKQSTMDTEKSVHFFL